MQLLQRGTNKRVMKKLRRIYRKFSTKKKCVTMILSERWTGFIELFLQNQGGSREDVAELRFSLVPCRLLLHITTLSKTQKNIQINSSNWRCWSRISIEKGLQHGDRICEICPRHKYNIGDSDKSHTYICTYLNQLRNEVNCFYNIDIF